jgi:isoprenylcysteine carboxyl methyltransferase (ICMT) family protein YpbQ
MTAKKAGIMVIVFTLIQLVCMTGVIINQNQIVDLCIIGFQAIMILVQILIMAIDTHKSNKNNSKRKNL